MLGQCFYSALPIPSNSKLHRGLKMSSHNCSAVSSSSVCKSTLDSKYLNPGGDSICNSLRLFRLFLADPSTLLRLLHLSAPVLTQNCNDQSVNKLQGCRALYNVTELLITHVTELPAIQTAVVTYASFDDLRKF